LPLEAAPLSPASAQTGRLTRGLGFAVIGDCGLCFETDVYFNSEFVRRLFSVGSFGSFVFLLIMVCFGLDCIAAPFVLTRTRISHSYEVQINVRVGIPT
jgi:hypothetical protein